MIAIDKLIKIILVAFVIGLVIFFFKGADINRYMKNVIPTYVTPEHDEIPVEEIEGICDDGWTMIARSVSGGSSGGNYIGFCRDEKCSKDKLVVSKIVAEEVGDIKILYIKKSFSLSKIEIGTVGKDGMVRVDDKIFNGEGVYEEVKDLLPEYEDLINLDVSRLAGEFICRRGEKLEMIEEDRIEIENAKENICEVDEDNLLIGKESCTCLTAEEVGFFGASNYERLSIGKCSSSMYCYKNRFGCSRIPIFSFGDFSYEFKDLWVGSDYYEIVMPSFIYSDKNYPKNDRKARMFEEDGNLIIYKMDTKKYPLAVIFPDGSFWIGEAFFSGYVDKDKIFLEENMQYFITHASRVPFVENSGFREGSEFNDFWTRFGFYESNIKMDLKDIYNLKDGLK